MNAFMILAIIVLTLFIYDPEKTEKEVNFIQKRNDIYYEPNQEEPYTGKYVSYYANGQKKEEGKYKNGKKEGLHVEWKENGCKNSSYEYKNGKLDGKADFRGGWRCEKWKIGQYKNGKKEGTWVHYYFTQEKESERNYINGVLDGFFTSWHENGQIASHGYGRCEKDIFWCDLFTNTLDERARVGTWRFWDENGNLEKEVTY
tara:strand:- start:183 stop:788 length:606 start_codon:yes stop_codon:yes gene_type:complete